MKTYDNEFIHPMTPAERIEQIRERLGNATQEAWIAQTGRPADAEFIANAPTDLAWCLDEIEKLQEVRRCAAGVVRTAHPAKISAAVVSDWWSALRSALGVDHRPRPLPEIGPSMTDPRIEQIRERLAAATTSVWYDSDTVAVMARPEDAEFIAHAPEDVAVLLAEIGRLNREIHLTNRAQDFEDSHGSLVG